MGGAVGAITGFLGKIGPILDVVGKFVPAVGQISSAFSAFGKVADAFKGLTAKNDNADAKANDNADKAKNVLGTVNQAADTYKAFQSGDYAKGIGGAANVVGSLFA